MLLICFRIKARSPKNFPYMRCNTVFRKSRSLGSSESKSSNSYPNKQKLLVNSTTLSAESKTHLQNELLIDHTLADGRLEILRLQEPQEHLIHQLQVWPGSLQSRIILLGIEIGILTGRQRAK